jgi:DNA-binding MarR family transcriptional regulator
MRLYARAMAIVDPVRVRAWSEAELTTTQLRLLMLIREAPGRTLRELASYLRVTPPSASGLVDRLVRQGYLRREDDTQDRRLVRHHLTERGLFTVADLERDGRALLESVLNRLDDAAMGDLIKGLELLAGAADGVRDVEATAK